ncbi:MAG TPA: tyrosine-type recombinase/integrase [Thermoanaerobaculia bacterium]|nr:tyrosine-type recombinase/integrase [Thermoanaerobaculia bacterium]
MPSLNLTDRSLRALSTDQEREDFYDLSFPAFQVRVGRNGSKTFYFRYRAGEGVYRRARIGKYPAVSLAEARTRARELEVEVDRGEDPGREEPEVPQALTVAQVAEQYLERWAKRRKRSWREDQRILERYVLPVLGRFNASEVRRGQIAELIEGIAVRGLARPQGAEPASAERGAPIQANRVAATLSKMYKWANSVELVEANPCLYLVKPGKENKKDRVLSHEELRTLWHELEKEPRVFATFFRLAMLLGQRPGEIARMEWSHLSGDVWLIPGNLTKSGREHAVPLPPAALGLIEAHRGEHPEQVLESPRRAIRLRTDVLAQRARQLVKRLGTEPWTPHDLRRTVSTNLASLGVDEFIIQRVVGHAYNTVTSIYNRYSYLKEKRAALELWEQRLMAICHGESAQAEIAQ